MRDVRSEIQENLSFTPKETDIYRIHQSGDLANLDGLEDRSLELLPSLLSLRDALYSPEFRTYLSGITGAGKLSGKKTDMAVNVYTPGCHLLCHDDVIGTRRVSYILYLTDPDVPWRDEWGGALRLYPTMDMKVDDGDGESYKVPSPDEGVRIPPAFGQLSLFAVQPGESFHDVEEVYAASGTDTETDDSKRVRMAISGWYHIPQEGEEGYEPGLEEKLAEKSSLMQLQGKADQFDLPQPSIMTYGQKPHDQDKSATQSHQSAHEERQDDETLSESDLNFLLKYLAPAYLTPDTLDSVAAAFTDQFLLVLDNILSRRFSASLRTYIIEQESQSLPTSSMDIESKTPWKVARPPYKHRFLYQQPKSGLSPQTQALGLQTPPASFSYSGSELQADLPEEESPIQDLVNNLLPSLAFKKWLQYATSQTILSSNLLARRFRRGNDYTLATGYDDESPRLEITLAVTPTEGWGDDEVAEKKGDKVEEHKENVKKEEAINTLQAENEQKKETEAEEQREETQEEKINTSQAQEEQKSKPEAEEPKEEGSNKGKSNTLQAEKEPESKTEAEEQETKGKEKIDKLQAGEKQNNKTAAGEQETEGKKNEIPNNGQAEKEPKQDTKTAAEGQEINGKKNEKPNSLHAEEEPEHGSRTAAEEQESQEKEEKEKPSNFQAEKEPEQHSKTEAEPTAYPTTSVGGYLSYLAPENDDGEQDLPADEAGSHAGIEIPPSLSTAGPLSSPTQSVSKTKNQPKSDPAVYQAADGVEDDGILFSMPAGWNRLGIVLRDRGTMRFVKYVSRAARGDRWDLVGEFAVKDVGDEMDVDSGEGGGEEGRGLGGVDSGEEETDIEIPTESDDSSI